MEVINTIGRRKTSVARICMTSGKGKIKINDSAMEVYFPSEILRTIVQQPLVKIEVTRKFDIKVNVDGGGTTGQAEAIRLAISRALCKVDLAYRGPLKSEGFLTRDSRVVERKKPGRRKARKAFQFSKR